MRPETAGKDSAYVFRELTTVVIFLPVSVIWHAVKFHALPLISL